MIVVALLASALVSGSAGTGSESRPLSLDECVKMALSRNVDVENAEAEVDAATAARASTAALLGPKLHVDGSNLLWSKPFAIPFAPPPAPPTVLRESNTRSITVSVIQPVTPLLAIFEGYKLQDLGVDVAKIQREATRRDVAYRVTEAYYRLLQAQSLAGVAATSVDQVQSQLKRASDLEAHGVLGRNDVLRVQIALAGAQQRKIGADGAVTLASGALAMAVGLPPSTAIRPLTVPSAPAAAPGFGIDDGERAALSGRVELKELDARIGQARAGRVASWERLAPTVSLIGSWQKNAGSAFQEKESRYAGAVLSWDVWDWGSTYFSGREASARVRQAESARAKVRDGIAMDARAAFVGFQGSLEAVRVAQAAVTSAEENYRIENRRYETAAATTFDVLDAESLLTAARAQYQTALYDSHIAQANLDRAMGNTPSLPAEP
jgi:outer membrane protein TolC